MIELWSADVEAFRKFSWYNGFDLAGELLLELSLLFKRDSLEEIHFLVFVLLFFRIFFQHFSYGSNFADTYGCNSSASKFIINLKQPSIDFPIIGDQHSQSIYQLRYVIELDRSWSNR